MNYLDAEYANDLEDQMSELDQELDALKEEIQDAHSRLTNLGVGKEHWSLSGRISALLIVIGTSENPIRKLQEICKKNAIFWDGMEQLDKMEVIKKE